MALPPPLKIMRCVTPDGAQQKMWSQPARSCVYLQQGTSQVPRAARRKSQSRTAGVIRLQTRLIPTSFTQTRAAMMKACMVWLTPCAFVSAYHAVNDAKSENCTDRVQRVCYNVIVNTNLDYIQNTVPLLLLLNPVSLSTQLTTSKPGSSPLWPHTTSPHTPHRP